MKIACSLTLLVVAAACGVSSETAPPAVDTAVVADVPDGGAPVDGVTTDLGLYEDAANGEDLTAPDVPIEDVSLDAEAPDALGDTFDDVDLDVLQDTAPDMTVDVGLPPGACCHKADPIPGECGPEGFCLAPKKTDELGQCVAPTAKGECWFDSWCDEGFACKGPILTACGEGPPTPGQCVPTGGSSCCQTFDWCGGVPCIDGFCAYPNAPGQCGDDSACALGYVCTGLQPPPVSCFDGGTEPPQLGTCTPNGVGGMCQVYTTGLFGACGDTLGYMWTGAGCVEVSGCDCGDYCASVFETYEGCLSSCAPALCCATADDCGEGLDCFLGHCVAPAPAGSCWSDADCDGANAVCVQMSWCACGQPCGGPVPPPCKPGVPCPPVPNAVIQAGVCANPAPCCTTVGDCGESEVCVGPGWSVPVCEPAPAEGECWTSADCPPGQGCVWAALCGCGDTLCQGQAGVCAPLPSTCCASDTDCDDGKICTAIPIGASGWSPGADVGRCVQQTSPSQCFSNAHCGPGSVCQGMSAYTCGAAGGGIPWGFCTSGQGACCSSDAQCPADYRCVGAAGFESQACQLLPKEGDCWETIDCDEGEVCMGAFLGWGCGSPDIGATLGQCAPIAGNCCQTDGECPPGELCTAKPEADKASLPGSEIGQCVTPPGPGSCFTSAQCGDGEACSGFNGLPCGKTPSGLGYCAPGAQVCCTGDSGCPEGWSCVGEVSNAMPGGCAKPPDPGACWEDGDCPEGEVCAGGYFCGPCSKCLKPTTLGTCTGK